LFKHSIALGKSPFCIFDLPNIHIALAYFYPDISQARS